MNKTKTLSINEKYFKVIAVVAGLLIMAMVLAISPINKDRARATTLSNNTENLSGLIAVGGLIGGGSGFGTTGGTSTLADLVILQGLFPTSRNANQNVRDLAGLMAIGAAATNGGGFGGTGFGTTGKGIGLGELIVANNLFLDP